MLTALCTVRTVRFCLKSYFFIFVNVPLTCSLEPMPVQYFSSVLFWNKRRIPHFFLRSFFSPFPKGIFSKRGRRYAGTRSKALREIKWIRKAALFRYCPHWKLCILKQLLCNCNAARNNVFIYCNAAFFFKQLHKRRFTAIKRGTDISYRKLPTNISVNIPYRCCRKIGGGRIAVHEILLWTDGLPNTIREGQISNIRTIIEANRGIGMCSMDGGLKTLMENGIITGEEAYMKASDKKLFAEYIEK